MWHRLFFRRNSGHRPRSPHDHGLLPAHGWCSVCQCAGEPGLFPRSHEPGRPESIFSVLEPPKTGPWPQKPSFFFKPELVRDFEFRRKRGGHLFSKMRFLSVQLQAYLENDLWRHNAQHANRLAKASGSGAEGNSRRRAGLSGASQRIVVHLPAPIHDQLKAAGFIFYPWSGADLPPVRLVTSFDMPETAVEQFLTVAKDAPPRSRNFRGMSTSPSHPTEKSLTPPLSHPPTHQPTNPPPPPHSPLSFHPPSFLY